MHLQIIILKIIYNFDKFCFKIKNLKVENQIYISFISLKLPKYM
jgi:hypothetical protein